MPAAHAIYASELLRKEWGFPLFQADPYGRPKVEIGDIGHVEDGKFLWVDRIPLEEVLGDDYQDHIIRTRFLTNEPIYSNSVRRRGGGGKVSIDGQLTFVPQLGASAGVAYECGKGFGAILNCREPFVCVANLSPRHRDRLKRHLEAHFFEIQREHRVTLVCVTGVVMSRDWEAGVFCSTERQLAGELSVQAPLTPSLSGWFASYISEQRSVEKSGGHYHPIGGPRDPEIQCQPPDGPCYQNGSLPEQNQCLFFRSFRVQRRRSMIPRILRAAAEPKDDDDHFDSSDDDGISGSGPHSPASGSPFESPDLPNPYRAVAEEMLEGNDKQFVLVHDDDVIEYFHREAEHEAAKQALISVETSTKHVTLASPSLSQYEAGLIESESRDVLKDDISDGRQLQRLVVDNDKSWVRGRSGSDSLSGRPSPIPESSYDSDSNASSRSILSTALTSLRTKSSESLLRPQTPLRPRTAFSGFRPKTPFDRQQSAFYRSHTPAPGGRMQTAKEKLVPWQSAATHTSLMPSALPSITVPAPPPIFYGRENELNQLTSAILQGVDDRRGTHLAILGGGGMGKTSLALKLINMEGIKSAFQKHRYFINCEAKHTANDIIAAVASCLNIRLRTVEMKYVTRFIDYLPGGRILLTLDNFESPWLGDDQKNVQDVLTALCALDSVTLVITMRGNNPPAQDTCRWDVPMSLDVLPLSSAREAFLSVAPSHRGNPRVDALLLRVECMPLAVSLLAALAKNGDSIENLQRRLLLEGTSMVCTNAESRSTNLDLSVRLTLESKPVKEHPFALRLISLIALLPDGVQYGWAVPLTNFPEEAVDSGFALLNNAALTRKTESGFVTMLAPVRSYLRVNHRPRPSDEVSLQAFYYKLANRGSVLLGDPSFPQVHAILAPETDNMRHVLAHYLEKGDAIADLAPAVLNFTQYRFWFSPTSDLLEDLLERYSVLLEPFLYARYNQLLGEIHQFRGKLDDALSALDKAKSGFGSIDDAYHRAQCTHSIARITITLDDYIVARSSVEDAVQSFERCDAPKDVAKCKSTLAEILYMQDEYEEAKTVLTEARNQLLSLDDLLGAAHCEHQLGDILRSNVEEAVEAIDVLKRAQDEFSRLQYPLGVSQCSRSIGEAYRITNDLDKAREYYKQALSAVEDQDNRLTIAYCHMGLASILQEEMRLDDAVSSFQTALDHFRIMGHGYGVSFCLQAIGQVLGALSRQKEAREYLEEARAEYENLRQPHFALECTLDITLILLEEGEASTSIEELQDMLTTLREQQNLPYVAKCLLCLGLALSDAEKRVASLQALNDAHNIFLDLEDLHMVALTLGYISLIFEEEERYEDAITMMKESCRYWKQIGDEEHIKESEEIIEGLQEKCDVDSVPRS